MGATKEHMQSLYHIENQYIQRLAEIDSRHGELLPEDEEFLIINHEQLEQKSIAYLEVIKNKKAFITNIDDEIKRLQALKKVNDNLISRLENNLLTAVKTYGTYEVGFTKFGSRKSKSVEVDNDKVNMLPAKYVDNKIIQTPKKVEIRKALESGEILLGCKLIESENLKIN